MTTKIIIACLLAYVYTLKRVSNGVGKLSYKNFTLNMTIVLTYMYIFELVWYTDQTNKFLSFIKPFYFTRLCPNFLHILHNDDKNLPLN